MKTQTVLILAGIGAAAVAAYFVARKGVAGAASGAVGAVFDAGKGAATGAVLGLGSLVGLPMTDETECEAAIREGRTWDASFACPASTFIGSTWERLTSSSVEEEIKRTSNETAPAPVLFDYSGNFQSQNLEGINFGWPGF